MYTCLTRVTIRVAPTASAASTSPCVTITVSAFRRLSWAGSQPPAHRDLNSSATLVAQNSTSETMSGPG